MHNYIFINSFVNNKIITNKYTYTRTSVTASIVSVFSTIDKLVVCSKCTSFSQIIRILNRGRCTIANGEGAAIFDVPNGERSTVPWAAFSFPEREGEGAAPVPNGVDNVDTIQRYYPVFTKWCCIAIPRKYSRSRFNFINYFNFTIRCP